MTDARKFTSASFAYSDRGNAELFAAMFADQLRYDARRGRWLEFRWHRWHELTEGEALAYAMDVSRCRADAAQELPEGDQQKAAKQWANRTGNLGLVKAILAMAPSLPPFNEAVDWDSNPDVLAFENGVVDLRTGTLRPGRPGDFLSVGIGIAYDSKARSPLWLRTLEDIFQSDQERLGLFQRLAGYSLTGHTREKKFVICHGTGDNGKSLLLGTVEKVFEPICQTVRFGAFSPDGKGDDKRDIAELPGKRLVLVSETPEDWALDTATLKALTGGDTLKTARKYGHPFEFLPQCTPWFSTNSLPNVRDESDGYWSRVILLKFGATFTGSRADQNLREKLIAEAPGIAAWAVRGAVEWYRTGLATPDAVLLDTFDYRLQQDRIAEFLADRCVIGRDYRVQARDLYQAYCRWMAEGSETPLSNRVFGEKMKRKHPYKRMNSGGWYLGVGLSVGDDSDDRAGSVGSNPNSFRARAYREFSPATLHTLHSESDDPTLDPTLTLHDLPQPYTISPFSDEIGQETDATDSGRSVA